MTWAPQAVALGARVRRDEPLLRRRWGVAGRFDGADERRFAAAEAARGRWRRLVPAEVLDAFAERRRAAAVLA